MFAIPCSDRQAFLRAFSAENGGVAGFQDDSREFQRIPENSRGFQDDSREFQRDSREFQSDSRGFQRIP
ncbi:MAG: hypothetical protein IPN69_16560 [Acidobacteria bacterium]|nr:hypothetical protein [Acidobacteriota bacterium]